MEPSDELGSNLDEDLAQFKESITRQDSGIGSDKNAGRNMIEMVEQDHLVIDGGTKGRTNSAEIHDEERSETDIPAEMDIEMTGDIGIEEYCTNDVGIGLLGEVPAKLNKTDEMPSIMAALNIKWGITNLDSADMPEVSGAGFHDRLPIERARDFV